MGGPLRLPFIKMVRASTSSCTHLVLQIVHEHFDSLPRLAARFRTYHLKLPSSLVRFLPSCCGVRGAPPSSANLRDVHARRDSVTHHKTDD